MAPKSTWPALNAIVTSTTIITIEHCTELLDHGRALRRHLNETNQKTVPKPTFLGLLEGLEMLAAKLLAGPEFERVEARLPGEIQNMHKDLAKEQQIVIHTKSGQTALTKKLIRSFLSRNGRIAQVR